MDCAMKTYVNISQTDNICQCCFISGCHKNIFTEYYDLGQKEVYGQMLQDTFDIQIIKHETGNTSNCLICEQCISRLRDAYHFKEMVKQTQDKLLEMTKVNYVEEEMKTDEPALKINSSEECISTYNVKSDDNSLHITSDDDDNENLATLRLELNEPEKLDERSKRRKSDSRGRKRKKAEKDKNGDRSQEKDWTKIAERRGNGPLLREDTLTLLANSTLCIFQYNKSRYRCFCCKEPFSDINALRDHTDTKHNLKIVEKIIIAQQNRPVKVEISSLFCKLCNSKLENLKDLRDHLRNHQIEFKLNEDLLVPFKIGSNLQCQICFQNFTMFRHLNLHMMKHFQKQVCHICGAGFSNVVFLNAHKARTHRPVLCKQCNMTFKTKLEKKQHDISEHKLIVERKLRFPCPYCEERFYQENFRVQHLVEKHGWAKPEHKCFICGKAFITRSLCNNHVKHVHLKQKNQECDVCHHLFYTKADVARHKVVHTGEKKYSCSLCNNLFATKDSLRRHMKRTHNIDTARNKKN